VTNGDGLYQESSLSPAAYGDVRMAEAVKAIGAAGVPAENAGFLKFSELEIYRRMAELYRGATTMRENREFFDQVRVAVRTAVFDLEPDIVFTCAWQGGQPEHDLTHLFTMLALRDLERERGVRAELFHLPEYEYTILLAMRFHPLYPGVRYRLRLTPAEMDVKRAMVDAYPSQKRLFEDFRRVFGHIGRIGRLVGGPATAEEYLSVEEFGPVPAGLDYRRKPHLHDYFTYMYDHFEGTPVTFTRSILPVVDAFL
jgi:LmbE family N-acetylglucosaminyl deacetylase